MKWNKGAKEDIVVAGGQGHGSAMTWLSYPRGLFVDTSRAIYVVDAQNARVTCSYCSEALLDNWVFRAAKCVFV